jgi:uncharacterized protein
VTVPARLSIVTIGAHDLELLRAFYRGLGWEEAISADDFSAFATGGAVLTLYPIGSLLSDARLDSEPSPSAFRGVTLAINVESVEAVDAAFDAATAAGATVLKEPETAEWGGRSGYFADPEGNVWEVAWMPGSSFDQRDALILPYD